MSRVTTTCLIIPVLALAACSNGDGPGQPNLSDPAFLAQVEAAMTAEEVLGLPGAKEVLEDVIAISQNPAPAAAAMAGTATYDGGMVVGGDAADSDFAMHGSLSMNADFDNGKVVGIADQFVGYETGFGQTGEYLGGLAIEGSIENNRLTADLGGDLTPPGEAAVAVSGTMVGEFRGEGAEGVAGSVNLEAQGDSFSGAFAADRAGMLP